MRALVLTLALALFAALGPAAAVESEADRAAIRGVIESQLDAFRADDGPRAYSYAAPSIRRLFPSQERFMQMVRTGYPPVYRPRDVVFGALRETPHGPVQEVFITDQAGVGWVALYALERQADGSWKIAGCQLLRRPGLSA